MVDGEEITGIKTTFWYLMGERSKRLKARSFPVLPRYEGRTVRNGDGTTLSDIRTFADSGVFVHDVHVRTCGREIYGFRLFMEHKPCKLTDMHLSRLVLGSSLRERMPGISALLGHVFKRYRCVSI